MEELDLVREGSDRRDGVAKREMGKVGNGLTEQKGGTKVETRELEVLHFRHEELEISDDLEGFEVLPILRHELRHGLELLHRGLEQM